MVFQWDTNKNRKNLKKHGIDFEDAAKVFLDDNRIERYDYIHSNPCESRYVVIGIIEGMIVVTVICLFAETDSIRIISARKATGNEVKEYYDQNKNSRRS